MADAPVPHAALAAFWQAADPRDTGAATGHTAVRRGLEAAAPHIRAVADTTPHTHTPDVVGYCPACGGQSLMLASGGHITCRRLDCPNPVAVDDMLTTRPKPVDLAAPGHATPADIGWAVLELTNGHCYAGYISEITVAGAPMLKLDIPTAHPDEQEAHWYAPTAVQSITSVTEGDAKWLAQHMRGAPAYRWQIEKISGIPPVPDTPSTAVTGEPDHG